ncbi:MAG: N-succinylarginine dihydrolase [Hyphomonadaceae bacterium]|nr:N-succinylarginine dihydrolase [Hyphomonadaceae bacterium]
MTQAMEVNFDGLIGPTHNYGGLSDGNLASAKNAGDVSNPREAALQGLEKMRMMVRAGLTQGVLPPHPRPDEWFLERLGFGDWGGMDITAIATSHPRLLKIAYSASAMWTANAATISPSADCASGKLNLTPANLSTMLHRSGEHEITFSALASIFPEDGPFALHPALPSHPDFADEGAANHVRLCAEHGGQGVELFVYGREAGESAMGFPARQTLQACQAIARGHGLSPTRAVFARQARRAIEAGAFHNDVVCVGTLDTLFFHEFAFEDTQGTLEALRRAGDGLFELKPVMVPEAEVPLEDAISSYLFNSQLLRMPGEDRLVLVAPTETRDTPSTARYCEQLVAGNGPIGRVHYVDVRQSMRNGGGPACLRLRVVLTPEELAGVHPGVILDEAKIDALQAVVRARYRDRLAPADLADPDFAIEALAAYEAIVAALELPSLA